MAYEIIGSRIVAPYIGTSTYIWTSLIGVILAALSLGYWLGGRFADRFPGLKALSAAIFLAGGAVSVTILIKDAVLSAVAGAGGPLEVKAIAAATLLFAPASVLLGFVTPYAVKLRTMSLEDAGKTVGRLYALSTIGSIAGTFAAGFFLVPFLGSTRTLYMIAALLFGISLVLAPFAFTRTNFAAVTIFVFGIMLGEAGGYYFRTLRGLVDVDTEYSRIQVFQSVDQKTGRRFRAIATDPYFAQSAMYLDDGSPVFEYTPFFGLVDHFKPDHRRTLMIGGAGYTIPKLYIRDNPAAEIDVVEIDSGMTKIARKYFGLEDSPRMNIFHQDGRVFLNQAPSGIYDAVFLDAFGSLFSIPFQLTTVEAVQHLSRVLAGDGIVIVNIGSAIRGPASQFLQAELATFKSVFPHIFLFKPDPDRPDDQLQNVILIAAKNINGAPRRLLSPTETANHFPSRQDLSFGTSTSFEVPAVNLPADTNKTLAYLLSTAYLQPVPLNLPPLTDNLAPVEHYNSRALQYFRTQK